MRAKRAEGIYYMEQKPVFVKLDEYKTIVSLLEALKAHVENAKQTLDQIHKLKQEEDVELEIWHTVVGEIEKRMDFVDASLTQPEEME